MPRRTFQKNMNGGINMTPMIDVVFQMIIFFVCTAQLEREQFSEWIKLPGSPHSPEMAQEKDPRTITIEVDERGKVTIGRTLLSISKLRKVLEKAISDYGEYGISIPIQIRADAESHHSNVRKVMDVCTSAGLYKIAFIAVKDGVE